MLRRIGRCETFTMTITSWSFIIVLLMCFVKSAKGASLATDRKNIHGMCPVQFKAVTSTLDTNCRYRITNETTQLQYALKNNIKWEDGTTRNIHIKILTEGNDTIETSSDILFPNQWMLSYIDPNGPYYYVSWRSDFKVLSLGLLNGISDKPIQVDIQEMSGNCTPTLGSDDTTTAIVQLMSSFIRQAGVLGEDNDYENINLCFLTKFDWFLTDGWYKLKQYFGIPFQEFGYKCCMVRNETVCCDDRLHAIEGYRVVPYVIAVILVCYFPVILMKIGNCFKQFDSKVYLENFSSTCNYQRHTQNSDDKIVSVYLSNAFLIGFADHQYIKTSHGERLHLDPCCICKSFLNSICKCKSYLNCICKCKSSCSCNFEKCRKCRSQLNFGCLKVRWKRILFLTLAPVLIYIEIIIFSLIPEWKTTIHQINKNKLLFGFTSMEDIGKDALKNNTFIFPIGPIGALILYYVSGIIFLVSPTNFEQSVIEMGFCDALMTIINGLAPKQYKYDSGKGYNETERILTTLMFLPLNPLFWTAIKGKIRKLCFFVILILGFPFIGIPIIPFSVLILISWMSYAIKKINGWIEYAIIKINGWLRNAIKKIKKGKLNDEPKSMKKCNEKIICFVTGIGAFGAFILFMSFAYMFILVISYSIYLLIYVMYFVSIAFIISPNETSKYLVFSIWGCIFLFQTWRDFKNYYKNLFDMVVKICEGNDQLKQNYIVLKDNTEYIKEILVIIVFRKVSPVFVQVGHIILKFALVILVYVSSILFLNTNSEQLADLIEHVTVLATSALPVIIQYQFKTVCPTERLVKYTINSYSECKFRDRELLEEINRGFDIPENLD